MMGRLHAGTIVIVVTVCVGGTVTALIATILIAISTMTPPAATTTATFLLAVLIVAIVSTGRMPLITRLRPLVIQMKLIYVTGFLNWWNLIHYLRRRPLRPGGTILRMLIL